VGFKVWYKVWDFVSVCSYCKSVIISLRIINKKGKGFDLLNAFKFCRHALKGCKVAKIRTYKRAFVRVGLGYFVAAWLGVRCSNEFESKPKNVGGSFRGVHNV
jgi:hypothetical protein